MGRLGASRRSRATAGNRVARDAHAGTDPHRTERRDPPRDDRALRRRTSLLGSGCRARRPGRLRRALPTPSRKRRADSDAPSRLPVDGARLFRACPAGHGETPPGACVAGAGDGTRVRPGGGIVTPDRSCWIDPFNDARGDLKTRFGITTPVFDGRWLAAKDPVGALAYLKAARAKFGGAGIYLCSQGEDSLGAWPNASTTDPVKWASWANDMVQRKIAPGTGGSFPVVHLNCETHNGVWIIQMLAQWRKHQPKRETALLIEGMQGGWFKAIASGVAALNVTTYAEAFHGPMTRSESEAVLRDLLAAGVPYERAGVCLDASQLGDWWSGVAFSQGRLPA